MFLLIFLENSFGIDLEIQAYNPTQVERKPGDNVKPVKWGILGAANIAPSALIIPAKALPEVEVYAVAARDIRKADAFAKKHGIPKTYEGYQSACHFSSYWTAFLRGSPELLDDPDVEVVYNPVRLFQALVTQSNLRAASSRMDCTLSGQ